MSDRVIIFQKNPMIKRSLKNGCSKNFGKLQGNQLSRGSFLVKLQVKSGYVKSGYLNDVGN